MRRNITIIIITFLVFSMFSKESFSMNKKKWTIMVFLNADNNLERAGIEDLNEMEIVGSSKDVNVIVMLDRSDEYDKSNGNWSDTKIFYVTKDRDTHKINSKVIKECGEKDMGSIDELVDFVKFSMENYPAEKYVLDIWNHGAGWKKRGKRGISFDDKTKSHISMNDLRDGLKKIVDFNNGEKIDVLGFDACLMAMVEVAYSVKDYAKVLVAAEETEPGDGWEYQHILKPLVKNSNVDERELSKIIVQAYLKRYKYGSKTCLSSVDLTKFNEFLDLFFEYVELLKRVKYKDYLIKAANQSKSYAYRENKDFYNFLEKSQKQMEILLDELYPTDEERKVDDCDDDSCAFTLPAAIHKADKLKKIIKEMVIDNVYTDESMKDSHGLAIYHPTSTYQLHHSFEKTYFAKETNWLEYLNYLLKKDFKGAVKEVVISTKKLDELRDILEKEENQIVRADYNEVSTALSNLKNRIKISIMKDLASQKYKKFDYLVKFIDVNSQYKLLYKDITKELRAFLIKKINLLNELGKDSKELNIRLEKI